jgi:hypothetical protein
MNLSGNHIPVVKEGYLMKRGKDAHYLVNHLYMLCNFICKIKHSKLYNYKTLKKNVFPFNWGIFDLKMVLQALFFKPH